MGIIVAGPLCFTTQTGIAARPSTTLIIDGSPTALAILRLRPRPVPMIKIPNMFYYSSCSTSPTIIVKGMVKGGSADRLGVIAQQ